ncbi:4-alpha-glucanotransferase [Piscinibacter sakaiensis]|uniref:4-alpha-glucanotransferase n=1 Tax=Piscinibacter sakaiensis TaxID=1547922 RepID=UPI003AAAD036
MQTTTENEAADALHQLAERLGLSLKYRSASGDWRIVGDDTLRALCATSGYPAATNAEARQALAELDRMADQLDPVFVTSDPDALETAWHGHAAAGEAFDWRIELEAGEAISGTGVLRPASAAPANRRVFATLRVPLAGLPLGYHRLQVSCAGEQAAAALIVAPQRAYTPPAWEREQRRDWVITAQLYALRSARNWGIGDFSDLGELAAAAAPFGVSAIGLSPLHALFPANPRHLSPYSPSSRVFLNTIYVDVEAVPEFASCSAARALVDSDDFQARLNAVRSSELVDHEAVWGLKLQVLELLFDEFASRRERQADNERAAAFAEFRAMWGPALTRFARFEALHRFFVEQGKGISWHSWPEAYRRPDSPEVEAFAAEQARAVEFSAWLQWEADRQLGVQAQAMHEAGMDTGVYRDLAVGVDPNGGEAWGDQSLLVDGATVGAPPDLFNIQGQDWGLTPFSPQALRRSAYAAFIATIRANMRHAGAVRIDHVLGLKRLYWVPHGMGAPAGAYVAYPFEQLMGIIALESHRNRCLVVGEDLGTVPDGFREDAERRGLLSYRVLMFEREDGDGPFLPPARYPELAAAAVSTHDLPTLAGLWTSRDLDWRVRLGLYPGEKEAANDRAYRAGLLAALVDALGLDDWHRRNGSAPPTSFTELVEAAHMYLAKAPAKLLLVQIEDLAAEVEQMNLPGTVDQHPNWRRKLQHTTAEIFGDPAVRQLADAIRSARASPPG